MSVTRLALTPASLQTVASTIWGNQWVFMLARELDYNDRTVRRWMEGTRNIPPTLWPRLRARLIEHSTEALAMAMQLPTRPTMEEAAASREAV